MFCAARLRTVRAPGSCWRYATISIQVLINRATDNANGGAHHEQAALERDEKDHFS
jgi:hypothetical protein